MDLTLALEHWERFAWGVWTTLVLTGLAVSIGFVISVPAALTQVRRRRLAPLVDAYVYVFRGTPLIVQTYLIYYGLSQFETVRESIFWPLLREAWWCALIAFSLNSGAYMTEILRGALSTTAKGEPEAGRALGLTEWQITRLVLLPSAFRRALPQYGNEVVFMLHGSVVASVITIQDILGVGRWLNGKYYLAYEGLVTAALLYMALTFVLVAVFRRVEKRYLRHLDIAPAKEKAGAAPGAGIGAIAAR